mmetsp:Transcript_18429/g.28081  ORF Transcript_18429/g.28081 Transcript_18429/m.28081 type:complete len:184 (-) Transcript_18429:551-1102(-)
MTTNSMKKSQQYQPNAKHPNTTRCKNKQQTIIKHKTPRRTSKAKSMTLPTDNERNAPRDLPHANLQQQTKELSPTSEPTLSPTHQMTTQATIRMATINAIINPQGKAPKKDEKTSLTTRSCTKRQPIPCSSHANPTDHPSEESTTRQTGDRIKPHEHTPSDNKHITNDNNPHELNNPNPKSPE